MGAECSRTRLEWLLRVAVAGRGGTGLGIRRTRLEHGCTPGAPVCPPRARAARTPASGGGGGGRADEPALHPAEPLSSGWTTRPGRGRAGPVVDEAPPRRAASSHLGQETRSQHPKQETRMAPEANKALVRRLVEEVQNQHHLE